MSSDYVPPPEEVEDIEIRRKLFELREEHRALDESIIKHTEENPMIKSLWVALNARNSR